MLVSADAIPDNSQTSHPASYFASQGANDIYSMFAAGLTAEGASQCVPGPQAFVALSPAGSLVPQVTPGATPALSRAFLAPSPVSPLASQVAKTQQSQAQMLSGRSNVLGPIMDAAGQQGSQSQDAYPDAAEVLPMSSTANQIAEGQPDRQGKRHPRQHTQGNSRRSYDLVRNAQVPGVPWGSAGQQNAAGGCPRGRGLTLGQALFMIAGLGIITVAVLDAR